jgi:PII-like signaling protein
MSTVLLLFLIVGAQPILGLITKCPVVVEVVDMHAHRASMW